MNQAAPADPPALTGREVRRLALALPETEERSRSGRPSFRVGGRVFATLYPRRKRAVLKLSLHEQHVLRRTQPAVFRLAPWAHRGWTGIELRRVDPWLFEELLVGAWRRLAPRHATFRFDARRRAP
jgi:hypothetical protein